MSSYQHSPVLLERAIAALNIRPQGRYLDGTYGRGGHSRAILSQLGSEGSLLALDRDPQAIADAGNLSDPRFKVVKSRFSQLTDHVSELGWMGRVDGVLLDLGLSSPQLDDSERGFSLQRDGPLDMRMDPEVGMSAAEWLNVVEQAELAAVLKELGEERFAGRIARAVVERRRQKPFARTAELAELIAASVPRRERNKHPATRSFQAIRIHLNQELTELQQALQGALQVLAPNGRLVVISFHSLEDRLVKQFMRLHIRGRECLPKLPLTEAQRQSSASLVYLGKEKASAAEVANNVRARSAIMRVAQRKGAADGG